MEWFSLLLPIFAVILCYVFFRAETLWWEAFIPIGVGIITILIFKYSAETYSTSDTEYWNGTIVRTEYYEEWNEYIYQTCTSTDMDGNTYTYDCSYVDWHPDYWTITDDNGFQEEIPVSEYNRLVSVFGGEKKFVDLHRDYHSVDGDKYVSVWSGNDQTREIMVTEHRYENRVQASTSVFNYVEISDYDKEHFKLYEYPRIDQNFKQRHLLGIDSKSLERQLGIFNAKIGSKKELKFFICVFYGNKKAGELQESYWKGGNKNEMILMLGVDSTNINKINWVRVVSWTENQELKLSIRNYITRNKKYLNYEILIDDMYDILYSGFERKHFREFDYLEVELTSTQTIFLWVTMAIMSALMALVVVKNGARDISNRKRY